MILGIDPGLNGALAFYDPEGLGLVVMDMPTAMKEVSKKQKRVLAEAALCDLIRPSANEITLAVIENVHSMPDQGVTSSFTFGLGFGVIRGALAALKVKTIYVEPQTWKGAYGLTRDKKLSIAKAKELFPKDTRLFARAKDDGRAEAAILAHYGLRLARLK